VAVVHLSISEGDSLDVVLAAAQRLNYDVLSLILIISSFDWVSAPLTLASVCRLWRHVAISTPQIWTRIDFETSKRSKGLKAYLSRSESLPLHICISSRPSAKLRPLLPAIANRVACMRIIDNCYILNHLFPVLESLKLMSSIVDTGGKQTSHMYLSDASWYPKLKEIRILYASEVALGAISRHPQGFRALQKLELRCDRQSHWINIIQSVSNTLVSLYMRIQHAPEAGTHQFFLPKLRHLRITTFSGRYPLILVINAPLLESLDESCFTTGISYTSLRLQDPSSVKYLHTDSFPLNIGPYLELQRLWVQDNPAFSQDHEWNSAISAIEFTQLLKTHILSHLKLEAIMYRRDTSFNRGKRQQVNSGNVVAEIRAVVHETGRDILVREFVPSELNLPGSMLSNVSVKITVVHAHRHLQHLFLFRTDKLMTHLRRQQHVSVGHK
jgi:hypothetical protein